jgi:hypothetical protein
VVAAEVSGMGFASGWTSYLREPEPVDDGLRATPTARDYRSQFEGYARSTFRKYVTAIDTYPSESFDIVLVDGRARTSCVSGAWPKVKRGGFLILDNSERVRYKGIHDMMAMMNWKKVDFFGPGPYVRYEFWGTTAWMRTK